MFPEHTVYLSFIFGNQVRGRCAGYADFTRISGL